MKLEKNEYTTESFLEFLKKKFEKKISGEEFTTNDIAQYLIRGRIPYRYGRYKLTSKKQQGIRIITVKEEKQN